MGDTKSIKEEHNQLSDLYEISERKLFDLIDGSIEFDTIWIPSRVNYLNKLISELEEKKVDCDDGLVLLDSMMKFLEGLYNIILDPFRQVKNFSLGEINREYKPDAENSEIRKNFENSEKIERYLLKTLGKHVLSWSSWAFFLNKILLACLIIVFFNRSDYASVK